MNDQILKWLEYAKEDLKSSEDLYNNGMYRNSFFLFHSASEKVNKAYGFINESFTIEESKKKIGHNQFKGLKKILSSNENDLLKNIELLKELKFPFKLFDLDTNIISILKSNELYKSKLDSHQNERRENFNEEELDCFLKIIEQSRNIKIEVPNDLSLKLLELLQSDFMLEIISDEDLKDVRGFIEDEELINKLIKRGLTDYSIIIFLDTVLYYCALITSDHNEKTRYPSGKNAMELYNNNSSIIKKQLEFMKYLKEVIDFLYSICKLNIVP